MTVANGLVGLSSWLASMKVGDSLAVVLYTYDQQSVNRPVINAVTFDFTASGFTFTDAAGQPITGITVPAGTQQSPVFYIHAATAGQATLTISGAQFQQYLNSTTVQ